MVVIKNGHGLLDLGTQKSPVSQDWMDELGRFFACWYKFMKAKSYFNNYWVGLVKNWQGLKIVEFLNEVHLTNDLLNWVEWLTDFCMLIVMEYYLFVLNDTSILAIWKMYVWESYRPKCSPQIRLQYFLNFDISKTIWSVRFFFCM